MRHHGLLLALALAAPMVVTVVAWGIIEGPLRRVLKPRITTNQLANTGEKAMPSSGTATSHLR